jgi:6-pyruvoyltetrahydropterin/6-carboxytetrahydropterin synthase
MGPSLRTDLTRIPLKIWITLTGPCDPETGFIINVSEISRIFKEALAKEPVILHDSRAILDWAKGIVDNLLTGKLVKLELELNEKVSLTLAPEDINMIQLTTKYELAASHRLWNSKWNREENVRHYGKCSNPAGHGHNYILEVTFRGKPNPQTGQITDLEQLDQIVKERILNRFDHKNLNEDTEEFQTLIPTVENMAKVFWELLIGRFDDAQLYSVRLWETPKTYADYFGPAAGPLRLSENV